MKSKDTELYSKSFPRVTVRVFVVHHISPLYVFQSFFPTYIQDISLCQREKYENNEEESERQGALEKDTLLGSKGVDDLDLSWL